MAWFRCIGGGSSPTPTPTTPEAYIYNIGPVVFNTGYIPKTTTKIVFKAIPTLYAFNSTSTNNSMFGYSPNGDGNKYKRIGFMSSSNNNAPTLIRGGTNVYGAVPWNVAANNYLWLNQPNIITVDGLTASWYREVDPLTVNSITISEGTIEDGLSSIALFAVNYNTGSGFSYTNYGNMLLYYFEIYENSTLIKRFVPRYNNSQFCLYDEVGESYIYDVAYSGTYLKGFIPS